MILTASPEARANRGFVASSRWALLLAALLLAPAFPAAGAEYFTIKVKDRDSGSRIPCARLTTTGSIVHTSDAVGLVAFYEPGLMDEWVWFTVDAEGYSLGTGAYPNGTFLYTTEGGNGVIRMTRVGTPPPCASRESIVAGAVPDASQIFRIDVIDLATGRGVPLIEVHSPDGTRVTDSHGAVAFHDPALMGRTALFQVSGHGYELPDPDAAGGVSLAVVPGGHATVALYRRNVAQRLYRITGGGIYRDSVMLGVDPPLARPVLNGYVTGQDSALATLYRGRVFWAWGDTLYPSRPNSNRGATAATSEVPGVGGLDPESGVDLDYFVDASGHAKAMTQPLGATMWLDGLVAVPDAGGTERLFSLYMKVQDLETILEQGIVQFDDETELFEPVLAFTSSHVPQPRGWADTVRHADGDYVYYQNDVRVPARAEALVDPSTYHAFTALLRDGGATIDRAPDGSVRYAWRTGAPLVSADTVSGGALAPAEALFGHLVDPDTGRRPIAHANESRAWNEYRKRYVRFFQEIWGSTSFLGEIWYAEGDTPMGPWVYARKVVSHDDHSFYNPRHHPFFDRDGGRFVFFEGTYSSLFSSSPRTERYDYNQIMYRLDLEDERVRLPLPVYDLAVAGAPGDFVTKAGLRPGAPPPPIAFFAKDRPARDVVPVYWAGAACGSRLLRVGGPPVGEPLFYAVPLEVAPPPEAVPLYEYVDPATEARAYSVEPDLALPAYVRAAEPLAFVWRNPLEVTLPVTDYLPVLVADAGQDLCVTETAPGVPVTVALDASASSHASGSTFGYEWTWEEEGGGASASGIAPRLSLAAGFHVVTLTVRDEVGRTSRDQVVIDVGSSTPTQCGDGLDGDGDSFVDFPRDPGCRSRTDTSERDASLPCDDGLDNDADGRGDLLDPGCRGPASPLENPECDDGLDNDADGLVDLGADPDCNVAWDAMEETYEPACGLGAELVALLPLLASRRRSRSRWASDNSPARIRGDG